MKRTMKHALAIMLLMCFAVLALGSMGSSPGSSGGGYSGGSSSSSSSSSRCPEANLCRFTVFSDGTFLSQDCSRSSCRARSNAGHDVTPGYNVTCDCP